MCTPKFLIVGFHKMTKKLCFVITPIGKKNSKIRHRSDRVLKEIIAPAAKECGYETIRADGISKPGMITSQIIQHLMRDPLVVADLTRGNPNVYYELAIRHVVKKPVVQIIKAGEKLPFDIAPTRTIDIDLRSIKHCKEEVVKHIRTVEEDPSQVDTPISVDVYPNTEIYSTEEDINKYMLKLVSSGSTLDIVSERLHWVSENDNIKSTIIKRATSGVEINIYLPRKNDISNLLKTKCVRIHICPELGESAYARFTLVDKNRRGGAMLAIGSGRLPKFTISEVYESSNPQLVALASDYINSLRRRSHHD